MHVGTSESVCFALDIPEKEIVYRSEVINYDKQKGDWPRNVNNSIVIPFFSKNKEFSQTIVRMRLNLTGLRHYDMSKHSNLAGTLRMHVWNDLNTNGPENWYGFLAQLV